MIKLKHFLLVSALLLLPLYPLSSDTYYITEEQLMELENQSNKQKELIELQKIQLNDLNEQILIQDQMLNNLQTETAELEIQLNQAETSLKKSKNKSWIEKILVGIATFFVGIFTGGFLIYNNVIM